MKGYFPLPSLPLIAILRGLMPDQAEAVGRTLFEAGFRLLEVPLNRAGALDCIATLRATLPTEAVVGAGTVLTPQAVADVASAGGQMIVSPDCNPDVIHASRERGLWSLPGVATPTEAFAALRNGAHALKVFPSDAVPPGALKAWRAVLPTDVPLIPVGGITPDSMAQYIAAGANGFGIGGPLFAPERSPDELAQRARLFAATWTRL